MEPDDRKSTKWQQMETDTGEGVRKVWTMLAVVGAIGAISALLYLFLPPVGVAVAMVLIALLVGGVVLASGTQRPRHRL